MMIEEEEERGEEHREQFEPRNMMIPNLKLAASEHQR